MADIAKMLMDAINNYERIRKSNAQQNIQMNAQRSREFLANKGMKQRAAQFASRQQLTAEIAGMKEQGRAGVAKMNEEGRNRRFEKNLESKRTLSPKELIGMKAKEQSFIKSMGRPQRYEAPISGQYAGQESTGTRAFDNPYASVTGGPKTVKQPIYVRKPKTSTSPKVGALSPDKLSQEYNATRSRIKAR